MASVTRALAEQVADLILLIDETLPVEVSMVADYDTTSETGLKISVVPNSVASRFCAEAGVRRVARDCAQETAVVEIVLQARISAPTFDNCDEYVELLRKIEFELLEAKIPVRGAVYQLQKISLFDVYDVEQLEANVYSGALALQFTTAALLDEE